MKMMLFIGVAVLAGCAVTGTKIKNLTPGMSADQVINQVGKPDGDYRLQDGRRVFVYANRAMNEWKPNYATYYVVFQNDHMTGYVPTNVHQKQFNYALFEAGMQLQEMGQPHMAAPITCVQQGVFTACQ